MQSQAYWVGFNHIKGIGAVRFKKIQEFFGNLEIAWNAPHSAFVEAGLPQKAIENLIAFRKDIDPKALLGKILAQGIEVLTWETDRYPLRLKEIEQSPPVLYVKGDYDPMDEWAVAIVGTRKVSSYGRRATKDLASFLAKNGVTVVSGMARGVDGVAHHAALENMGRTLAVLGCGVDKVYPPEYRQLSERIIENGALISDYAPGTPPEGINFPPRNRIISGLSLATIVIEAGQRSGALITSTFAGEQGREVFALPGNIYSRESIGTNRLIQDGARPLLDFDEVLDVLNLRKIQTHRSMRKTLPVNDTEKNLLEILTSEPQHIDYLKEKSGLPIEDVSSTLTLLELKGMVQQTGGMNYISIRESTEEYKV